MSAFIYFHFDFATTIPLVHGKVCTRTASIDTSRPDDSAMRSLIATVATTPQIRCSEKYRNMLIPYVRITQMTSMRRQPNKLLKFFSQIQLHRMNVWGWARHTYDSQAMAACEAIEMIQTLENSSRDYICFLFRLFDFCQKFMRNSTRWAEAMLLLAQNSRNSHECLSKSSLSSSADFCRLHSMRLIIKMQHVILAVFGTVDCVSPAASRGYIMRPW